LTWLKEFLLEIGYFWCREDNIRSFNLNRRRRGAPDGGLQALVRGGCFFDAGQIYGRGFTNGISQNEFQRSPGARKAGGDRAVD
jgi:hypothetical protein